MTDSLKNLIAVLREELKSYGELLALLDRQQDLVVSRSAEELYQSIGAIQTQAAVLEQMRAHRDECRRAVTESLQLPEETPFGILIPLLPPDYQPLVQALAQENNELLVRVQQRARQNHLLLCRSLELMQQFLNALLPGHDGGVYTDAGASRYRPLPASALYEAIG